MTSRGRRRAGVLLAIAGGGLALAGCGGGASGDAPPLKAAAAQFEPSRFTQSPARSANPYLPLKPGTQSVREGATSVGGRRVPHRVTTTVTDVYRVVDGVKTVLVIDDEVDAGQVSQLSLDYLAEDRDGNVWVLGGYTEEYEGGRFVSAIDTWLSGTRGARAGVLVQADPRPGTPPYKVAQPDAEEGDVAEVLKTRSRRCVPFGCFDDVLVVLEGKASAPDNELKYYARGVGQIDNVPQSASVHRDVEELINLRQLSPRGLAQVSAVALRLDRHAARTAPGVFGNGPGAVRG